MLRAQNSVHLSELSGALEIGAYRSKPRFAVHATHLCLNATLAAVPSPRSQDGAAAVIGRARNRGLGVCATFYGFGASAFLCRELPPSPAPVTWRMASLSHSISSAIG